MKLCLVCNFQFSDEQDLCPKDLSKLVPVGKDPLIGMLIQDRYRIESLVAKGSMGVVYKAMQEAIGRAVAVKVMHGYLVNDDESMKRYHKEAKAASRLNHPNITTVYDFGVLASGQPYIVMDLLQGKSLADILNERGQLTMGQTLMVMNQVCQALGEAHNRGIVHRDIKPENIVIEELQDGRGIHVKVVDFGIATFSAGEDDTIGKITKTGTICGSPFYMSPEQCDAGKTDTRSDLYSLGIVLFECLTGMVPFESKDIYLVLSAHVKDPPPRLSKVRPDMEFSQEIEMVVAKALAKDADARFQSAQEMWNALAAAAGSPAAKRQAAATGSAASQQNQGGSGNVATAQRPLLPGDEEAIDPDALRRKINEATGIMQKKVERAQAKAQADAVRYHRPPPRAMSAFDRVVSFLQMIVPPILTLILTGALFWVIANQTIIHSLIKKSSTPDSTQKHVEPEKPNTRKSDLSDEQKANLAALMSQDKLEEAKEILDGQKQFGELSPESEETYDRVCIKLARKEARSKHYKQAIADLDQISDDAKSSDEVKSLLKKYRRLAK
jgi:serine/threonine protein kinase